MENVIIIGIIVVMILIGLRSAGKHFKGEGGCCGSGTEVKPKKKKLKNVIREKTFVIEGMICEHCKNRVEGRLNEVEGVSCKVNLKKGIAVVSMEKDVSDDFLKQVIEKAGYRVAEG